LANNGEARGVRFICASLDKREEWSRKKVSHRKQVALYLLLLDTLELR